MPSLPQVLHEAAKQSASEVVIEVGKEPVLMTSGGLIPFASPLTEGELFDALGRVLAPEQQAELAVGNVVEFNMDIDGARWTLVTEASGSGILVRGRVHGSAARVEVGTPMELPPLEPFQPEVDEAPSGRRTTVRQTRWDMGIPDFSVDGDEGRKKPPSRTSQPAWVAEEAPLPPRGERPVQTHESAGGIALAPAEEGEPDFELRVERGGAADEVDGAEDAFVSVAWLEPEAPDPSAFSIAPPDAPSINRNTKDTPLATVPLDSGTDDDALAEFGARLGAGSLCLIRGTGAGVRLAGHVNGGVFTVIDVDDPALLTETAFGTDPGGTFVLRLEDPSTCLGWVLRRLEEGSKVIVETRARTLEGARRTLLGVQATVFGATWLDAHALHWITRESGAWILHSGDRR